MSPFTLLRQISCLIVLIAVCIGAPGVGFAQGDCTQFNTNSPLTQSINFIDTTHHYSANHALHGYLDSSCTYSGAAGSRCSVSCSDSYDSINAAESGDLTCQYCTHQVTYQPEQSTGSASAGGSVSCGAQVAFAVVECVSLTNNNSCGATVTINGSYSGIGGSISWPPGTIYTNKATNVEACAAETAKNSCG
jgi:hypothetical protein